MKEELWDKVEQWLSPFGRFVFYVVLFNLLVALYYPALRAPFLYDDIPSIVNNPDLRHPAELGRFFQSHPTSMQFDHRPVAGILTMLNFQLNGLKTFGYHVFNLLVHLGVAVLLCEFALCFSAHLKLTANRTFILLCILVWAVHPLNSVTVIFVAQRMESLMVFFYLGALYGLLRSRSNSGNRGKTWLSLSLVSACLCLGSKEVGITVIVALLLLDRLYLSSDWKSLFRDRKYYYIALGIMAVLAVGWWTTGMRIVELEGNALSDRWTYFTTQCRVVFNYMRLVVWPDPLVFVYVPRYVSRLIEWLPHAAALVGFVILVLRFGTRHRWVIFPGILFFLVLAPTSSFLPIPQESEAEWRMYLPSACVIVLLFGGLAAVGERFSMSRSFLLGGMVAAALVLGLMTRERSHAFRTPVSIWSDVVSKQPLNAKALGSLAFAHLDAGNIEQASLIAGRLMEISVRLRDEHAEINAKYVLGKVLIERKKFEEARSLFEDLVNRRPELGHLRVELAKAHLGLKAFEKAVEVADKALSLEAENLAAFAVKAEAMISLGKEDEARSVLARAESVDPRHPLLEKVRKALDGKKPAPPSSKTFQ